MDLFSNIIIWRTKKLYDLWNGTVFNDNSCMLRGSRSYVGQCPCSLKLQKTDSTEFLVQNNKRISPYVDHETLKFYEWNIPAVAADHAMKEIPQNGGQHQP